MFAGDSMAFHSRRERMGQALPVSSCGDRAFWGRGKKADVEIFFLIEAESTDLRGDPQV